jgi:hypothetical protein
MIMCIYAGVMGALLVMLWIASASAAPQAPGIELGPDHTQQVNPGQTIRYRHTLTNTGTTTDTFLVEASSTQRWPVELTAGIYPTEALSLSLKVGAQVTASFQVSLTVPPQASGVVEVTFITATSQLNPNVRDTATDTTIVPCRIQLPLILKRWPPIPYTPALYPIYNADQNNLFSVSWQPAELASTYVLEEATSEAFSNARVVYQGVSMSWAVPSPGKTPATYYYRVKARNSWGYSPWSNVEQVVVYPLFVGLQLRWDGMGYIRGSWYYDIGWHWTRDCNALTDANTIRCHSHSWYDPNPLDFDSETWDSYYSVSTGYFKSSSLPSNPSWKWSCPWVLPYDWQFSNGQTFHIDGQPFTVSGPHSGYTAFGQVVHYWQFVNKETFLYWDGGGYWTQYVHAGDIALWYDAGNTRLLLHSDALRREYYRGKITNDTVHYIVNLTSANAFPTAGFAAEFSESSETQVHHPDQTLGEIGVKFRDAMSFRHLAPMMK